MIKTIFKILPLILLASAIALSPSFSAGKIAGNRIIEIRIEDILIVIFGLIWITNLLISGRKKIEKPPLFFPILIWLSIGFVSVLTNWLFTNLSLSRGFFYFLKEIEFFVFYFYVFYKIKNINSVKFLINLWIFLAGLNIIYVVYQIISRVHWGEYGTAAICEYGVFPTGSFFFIIFIFLFNVFLYYFLNLNIPVFKKILLAILSILPIFGIFGSGSQTVFVGLILSLFLTLFLFFLKKKKIELFLIYVFILLLIFIPFLNLTIRFIPDVARLGSITSIKDVFDLYMLKRWDDVIKPYFYSVFNETPSRFFIIGLGKGYVFEAHNQYSRNFIETGIIGSIAFLFLIFVILKTTFREFFRGRDPLSIGLSAGFLIATLTMLFFSFATEPFIVVKPSEVYWFFAAMAMAVITINKKKNEVPQIY